MDTVTQGLMGACIGQAGFTRRLGGRAVPWGAAIAVLPDLDTLALAPFGDAAYYLFHRGITHSVFFAPVIAPLAGWLTWAWYRRRAAGGPGARGPDRIWWMMLWLLALWSQPLLDVFTSYGTQLLAPLSERRFAIDALPIIDLTYSAVLVAALLAGLAWRRRPRRAARAALAAIAFCAAWTAAGAWFNAIAEARVRAALDSDNGAAARVEAYPTLFQPFYRRAVVLSPEQVRIGYLTVLDADSASWKGFTPDHHPAVTTLSATRLGRLFRWFADDMVAARVERGPGGHVSARLIDLRYGLPFLPPDQSLWGVRSTFAEDGELLGEVQWFEVERRIPEGAIRKFWRDAFGLGAAG